MQQLNSSLLVQKKLLIYKIFQIGKSFLQDKGDSSASNPSTAIDWLRNAFKLVEQLEEGTMPGTHKLRVCSGSLVSVAALIHIRIFRYPC